MPIEPTRSSQGVPDPSTLTTEQLYRALAEQLRLTEARQDTLAVRIDAIDKASVILAENFNRQPTLLDRVNKELKDYFGLQVASIQLQFQERDVRANNSELAQKEFAKAIQDASGTAISAAFSAADKAFTAQNLSNADSIRKSELNFTERIKSLESLLGSSKETSGTENNALKDRLTKLETVFTTISNVRTEHRMETGAIVAMVVGAAAIVGVIVSIAALALKH